MIEAIWMWSVSIVLLFTADQQDVPCFDTQIVPVLTKAGCNSGACHGAAAGRAGFHLSLLGSDPAADHATITLAYEGRRINLARPDRSLLLLKATEQIAHGGEMALEADSPGATLLLKWIQSGASRSSPRKLTDFSVRASPMMLDQTPAEVQIAALASFDQQPAEDVTEWTVLSSTDNAAVEVHPRGRLKVRRRGQHVVIAKFLDRIVPIRILVPLSEELPDFSREPRRNMIDDHVLELLQELRIPVSPEASDSAWLRRVSLDLTGRLPEPETVLAFVKDTDPQKRASVVERMLQSSEFADLWTLRFARWLRIQSPPQEKMVLTTYGGWLRQQIHEGTPLDELARELLLATGDSHTNGPAGYYRMASDARGHAELAGRFFMGVRLGCANCHNHPLDRWTQDDYHGLAAVFAKLDSGRIVQLTPRGAVTNLRTGQPAVPRIPGVRDLTSNDDHRREFAEWLTSGENRYFATVMVNRLWRTMFGRGLVEPVDDLRDTNPPTHPELLTGLAEDLMRNQYSMRHTLRTIALSSAYARSEQAIPGNESDDRFLSHAMVRPLEPEVLLDMIADVTSVRIEFPDQPSGRRAVEILDPRQPAPELDALGRCTRVAECEESGQTTRGLATQLHLLNGELVNDRVTRRTGRLHRMIDRGATDEDIVREFYLRGFSREPTSGEMQKWLQQVTSSEEDERRRRLEDFLWSLLTSREFSNNH